MENKGSCTQHTTICVCSQCILNMIFVKGYLTSLKSISTASFLQNHDWNFLGILMLIKIELVVSVVYWEPPEAAIRYGKENL